MTLKQKAFYNLKKKIIQVKYRLIFENPKSEQIPDCFLFIVCLTTVIEKDSKGSA